MSATSPNVETTSQTTASSGDALFALITEQLAQERARKTWIEERGIGIVTTSAGLATLLFGLTALSAGLAGLAVAFPWPYRETDENRLAGWLEESDRDEEYHERRAARARLTILRAWRSVDAKKIWVIFAGMAFQTIALVLVAVAVVLILAAPLPPPAPSGG